MEEKDTIRISIKIKEINYKEEKLKEAAKKGRTNFETSISDYAQQ